mmetsp:Transcript_42760/g.113245  ORF Transcript_42760/g.113245 Transcript_42760/m.113245 type:complete len:217 (+) Transcript_42760:258-908(+)
MSLLYQASEVGGGRRLRRHLDSVWPLLSVHLDDNAARDALENEALELRLQRRGPPLQGLPLPERRHGLAPTLGALNFEVGNGLCASLAGLQPDASGRRQLRHVPLAVGLQLALQGILAEEELAVAVPPNLVRAPAVTPRADESVVGCRALGAGPDDVPRPASGHGVTGACRPLREEHQRAEQDQSEALRAPPHHCRSRTPARRHAETGCAKTVHWA